MKKNHRLLFYTAWLLINLIQASNTELLDDEAYYWVYSRFLDWGYFDHPPLVALFIKAGYSLFQNELGVRLLFVLLNTATIYLIHLLVGKKNDALFYSIVLSIAIAQIGGILAAPDNPLLFFVALFFLLYGRFLQNMNIINAVLLGCCTALMLYSKYQGVLIVLFTLLSNLKLFTRYQTYIAGITALLLFIPHLYWQYEHGFPSFQYHLIDRNAGQYNILFTVEYLLGQLGVAGPVVGWLLLWSAFKYRATTLTERALKFSLAGIYIFFLVSTAKGRVEANWTVAAFIPLIFLSHQYLQQHSRLRQFMFWSLPVTIVLILAVRVVMMLDNPPGWGIDRKELYHNNEWTGSVKQKAQGLPVVFINSYQKASKYWFYTKSPAFSLNTAHYRLNNFNFWSLEDSLISKPVYLSITGKKRHLKKLSRKQNLQFPEDGIIQNFYSFSKVTFTGIQTRPAQNGIVVQFTANTPANYLPLFQQEAYKDVPVLLAINKRGRVKDFINTGFTLNQITGCCQQVTITIKNLPTGNYITRLCIGSCLPGFPSANSSTFRVTVN